MSIPEFFPHRVFRETPEVTFYDISVPGSNATDLVIHGPGAVSPPDGQFYVHRHQTDYNRVVGGSRTFELVNRAWENPYHIVTLDLHSGALVIPPDTYHRSVSGHEGSIVINHAVRDEYFDEKLEFIPVPRARLCDIIDYIDPIRHGS